MVKVRNNLKKITVMGLTLSLGLGALGAFIRLKNISN